MSKWVPIAGAACMAAWAKYSTKKVGEICCQLLEKEIVFSAEELSNIDNIEAKESDDEMNEMVQVESMKIMINLAKVDGLDQLEISYLRDRLNELEIGAEVKTELTVAILADGLIPVDFTCFQNSLDKALLNENLKIVSELDNQITDEEKAYIAEVEEQLG